VLSCLQWVERIYEYDVALAWGENVENKTQKEKKDEHGMKATNV
jgi:hypothetical protein